MNTLTSADPLTLNIDIETIPSRDPEVMREIIAKHATEPLDESTIKPAANLTDPAKIAADLEKRLEKARAEQVEKVDKAAKATDDEYRKTALDASLGHIACISAAFNEEDVFSVQNAAMGLFSKPVVTFAAEGDPRSVGDIVYVQPGLQMVLDDEREMIADFFDQVETWLLELARWMNLENVPVPKIVVHHAAFDVRFIWQRAIILGVRVPAWWPVHAKPWDTDRIEDTMLAWAGHGNRIGLDRLCRALGIPGKTGDMDGSKVWDAIQEGRINDVVDYCEWDVRRLRSVHRRLNGLPVLDQDIPVKSDDEAWLEPAPAMDDEEAA